MKRIILSPIAPPADALWERTTPAAVEGISGAELLDPATSSLLIGLTAEFGGLAIEMLHAGHHATFRPPPLQPPVVVDCPPVCGDLDVDCDAVDDPCECYVFDPHRGFCPFLRGAN